MDKEKLKKYSSVQLVDILDLLPNCALNALYVGLERKTSREDSSRFNARMRRETGLKERRLRDLSKPK